MLDGLSHHALIRRRFARQRETFRHAIPDRVLRQRTLKQQRHHRRLHSRGFASRAFEHRRRDHARPPLQVSPQPVARRRARALPSRHLIHLDHLQVSLSLLSQLLLPSHLHPSRRSILQRSLRSQFFPRRPHRLQRPSLVRALESHLPSHHHRPSLVRDRAKHVHDAVRLDRPRSLASRRARRRRRRARAIQRRSAAAVVDARAHAVGARDPSRELRARAPHERDVPLGARRDGIERERARHRAKCRARTAATRLARGEKEPSVGDASNGRSPR